MGAARCLVAVPWIVALTASCAQPPPATPPVGAAGTRDVVVQLIGTAACTSDAQCRSLPLGSSPCGGPEGYLPYSVQATDVAALEAAAQRYADARRADHQRSGRAGICAIVEDPGARCGSSRLCVLGDGRGGGSAR